MTSQKTTTMKLYADANRQSGQGHTGGLQWRRVCSIPIMAVVLVVLQLGAVAGPTTPNDSVTALLAARNLIQEQRYAPAQAALLRVPPEERNMAWAALMLQTDESLATYGDGTTPLVYADFYGVHGVVTVDEMGMICRFHRETGALRDVAAAEMAVTHAALSPDGNRMALLHILSGQMQIRDMTDNRLLHEIEGDADAVRRQINASWIPHAEVLQWGHDGAYLLWCVAGPYWSEPDSLEKAYLLDTRTNTTAAMFAAGYSRALAISPDGAYLAGHRHVDEEHNSLSVIRLRDLSTIWPGPDDASVWADNIAFSPDSTRLGITGTGGGRLTVVNLESGTSDTWETRSGCVMQLLACEDGFWNRGFGCDSPGRAVFFTAYEPGSPTREIYTGSEAVAHPFLTAGPYLLEQRFRQGGGAYAALHTLRDISPEIQSLWSPNGSWPLAEEAHLLQGHGAAIRTLRYNEQDRTVLTASADGTAKRWAQPDWTNVKHENPSPGVTEQAQRAWHWQEDASAKDLSFQELDPQEQYDVLPSFFYFFYRGNVFTAPGVTLWHVFLGQNVDTAAGIAMPPRDAEPNCCVAQKKVLLLESVQGPLFLLDTDRDERLWEVDLAHETVVAFALSPDARYAVVSTLDSLRVFNAADGALLWRVQHTEGGHHYAIAWAINPRSNRIILNTKVIEVLLLDLDTGALLTKARLADFIGNSGLYDDMSLWFRQDEQGIEGLEVVTPDGFRCTWDPVTALQASPLASFWVMQAQ